MAFYSISSARLGRAGEPKTTFNEGQLSPGGSADLEIRVDTTAFINQQQFWAEFERLERRLIELRRPRRGPHGGVVGQGEPWSDGTFWSDGTGWVDGETSIAQVGSFSSGFSGAFG